MKLAAILVGLAVAAALAWFAAEQHYDNCVEAAQTEYEGQAAAKRIEAEFEGMLAERVRGCSRLPW